MKEIPINFNGLCLISHLNTIYVYQLEGCMRTRFHMVSQGFHSLFNRVSSDDLSSRLQSGCYLNDYKRYNYSNVLHRVLYCLQLVGENSKAAKLKCTPRIKINYHNNVVLLVSRVLQLHFIPTFFLALIFQIHTCIHTYRLKSIWSRVMQSGQSYKFSSHSWMPCGLCMQREIVSTLNFYTSHN